MDAGQRPLWVCPECGHSFVTTNLAHSCTSYDLDHHTGKDLLVHKVFDALAGVIQSFGPVTIYAQKTRIVFQVRVRFVAVIPKKHTLDGHIWLKRRADELYFHRIEHLGPVNVIHNFRLTDPVQLDEGFVTLLRESYAVG